MADTTPTWFEYAQRLPSGIPDTAYDAQREAFFEQYVRPEMLKSGSNLETARKEFMSSTERPGKSAFPRLELAGAAALHGFAAPIAGLVAPEAKAPLESMVSKARHEAEKQGIWPTPYEMVGEMAGAAPYWIPALRGARALAGTEAALKAGADVGLGPEGLHRLFTVGAGGLVQGAYDAAKADDGHRIQEGLAGARTGALVVGGFEALGSLAGMLRARGLPKDAAEALADTARGVASDAQQDLATRVMASEPQLGNTIQEWLTGQIKAAKASGLPKEGTIVEPGGRLKIRMQGADGKPYNVGGAVGIDVKDIDTVVDRISQHLDAGGEITNVRGDPEVIHKLFQRFEDVNAQKGNYAAPLWIRGMDFGVQKDLVNPEFTEATERAIVGERGREPNFEAPGLSKFAVEDPSDIPPHEHYALSLGGEGTGGVLTRYSVLEPGKKFPKEIEDYLKKFPTYDPRQTTSEVDDVVAVLQGRKPAATIDVFEGHYKDDPAVEKLLQSARDKGFTVLYAADPKTGSGTYTVSGSPAVAEAIHEGAAKQYWGGATNPEISERALGRLLGYGEFATYVRGANLPEKYGIRYAAKEPREPVTKDYMITPKGEMVRVNYGKWGNHAEWEVANPDIADSSVRVAGNAVSFIAGKVDMNNVSLGIKAAAENSSKFKYPDVIVQMDPPGRGQPRYYVIQIEDALANPDFATVHKTPMSPAELVAYMNPKSSIDNPTLGDRMRDLATRVQGTPPGTTPFYAERPLATRFMHEPGQYFEPGSPIRAGTQAPPGAKPRIDYVRGYTNAETVFHENLHGHFGNLGMDNDIALIMSLDKKMAHKLYNGFFSPEVKKMYGDTWPEELYTYAASAVRTGNEQYIGALVEADESREKVMQWLANTTDDLLSLAAEKPDSLHKRVLERKLGEILRRSTGELQTLGRDTVAVFGDNVSIVNGKYMIREGGNVRRYFSDRESLVKYIEDKYSQPVSSPNLIDESAIPRDTPRYAITLPGHSTGRPPVQTDPPPPFEPLQEPVEGGVALLSKFFRPFYPWLDSVARKLERPELYDLFKNLDRAGSNRDLYIAKWEEPLRDAIVGPSLLRSRYAPARQIDFMNYLKAVEEDRPTVARQLQLTPNELADLGRFEKNFIEPLAAESNIDFGKYLRTVQEVAQNNIEDPATAISNLKELSPVEKDYWKHVLLKGEIDPNDMNLLRVSHSYLRTVARDQTMGAPLDLARKYVDTKNADGDYILGNYRPLFKRHLDYVAGIPDYTQRIVDGTMRSAIDTINKGIDKVNAKMPESLQIEKIEASPRDVLGRWILFSYAGGLGLRPMVPIRDTLQIMLTTYPMLGGKYLRVGMERAFPALKEGAESTPYKTAEQYGALMRYSDLSNLYSGGYESLQAGGKVTTALTGASEKMLKPLQWSNNSNRLVAFWGHAERTLDALNKWGSRLTPDTESKLLKDAGMVWLDDSLKNQFLTEIRTAPASSYRDISFRVAKELVDVSQWNYRRGASPGVYEYALGRLFGQYGTWPLNYIEYARRLATKGDAGDRAQALARLVLAHGAVLSAGEAMAIDTAQWVFTQPMAYGGSPIFQAVSAIPESTDFETYRGAEARRSIIRPVFPMMFPGGLAAERIYKAITTNSPTALQEALGFSPMNAAEEKKFYHQAIP